MCATDLHETTVLVSGLNCGGCVGTLTRKALGVYGVVHVDVELDPGRESQVVLRHAGAVDAHHVGAALSALGYHVTMPVAV